MSENYAPCLSPRTSAGPTLVDFPETDRTISKASNKIACENYSFAQLAAITARVHGIPMERFCAWSGNIKYLQKQRLIPSYQTGRGIAAAYSADDIVKALFVLELHGIGMTPVGMRRHVDEHCDAFCEAVSRIEPLTVELSGTTARPVTMTFRSDEIAKRLFAA